MIRCDADNYKYTIDGDKIYVYNGIYESNRWLILVAALLEAFLPDNNTFRVPIAICIQNNGQETTVNKNLEIIGNAQYEYFIPKEHYEKWRSTYALVYYTISLLIFASTAISWYIFLFKSSFNLAAGLIATLLTIASVIVCVRIKGQRQVLKKYPIKSMR